MSPFNLQCISDVKETLSNLSPPPLFSLSNLRLLPVVQIQFLYLCSDSVVIFTSRFNSKSWLNSKSMLKTLAPCQHIMLRSGKQLLRTSMGRWCLLQFLWDQQHVFCLYKPYKSLLSHFVFPSCVGLSFVFLDWQAFKSKWQNNVNYITITLKQLPNSRLDKLSS